ncbi:MAG: preprotein translocase subunit SecA, partial [Clostridia bacterium]|nr:preprotein translocase subunit SecA [Clostridia bacterium]
MKLIDKLIGTYSQREIKKLKKTVDLIESKEEEFRAKTDDELAAITPLLKERYQNGETLDDLLPDAFAAVREAADRTLGKRPFRVQLIGGIILHQGRIAEMKTGEGKTLVATLPAYLNALTGKGVHIVTVNDYLARCGAEEMGRVFAFLGMTTGLVVHGQYKDEKQKAYQADITYGTNNEFGFDYLRDNMVVYKNQMVQRGHSFAIVDEVDSVLIDEARTPLIISGEGEKSTDLYERADQFASGLKVFVIKELDDKESHDDIDADYIVDEKAKTATLTASGVEKAERYFGLENLSDPENATISHHINQAIRAHGIMKKEVDYIVKDDQVIIVDTFTGRLMPGRRYNEGLHQAIEAKEKVKVQKENKTLATVTFQNYFRMYEKLSGMTGTALTEEMEFREIYGLDVVEVPTNKPMIRIDHPDRVYKNLAGKYRAIIAQIEECHEKGQPVLVGTISIDKSELISKMLKARGIPHTVLNAKYHEREAEIVAQAGKLGAVTISTNMAGRGTDIMLGGNAEFLAKAEMRKRGYDEETVSAATSFFHTDDEEILAARKVFRELKGKFAEEIKPEAEKVCALGGLFILGTERHESRRIDNQLRGRSGRQGDPGESRFFLSLEDDLLRLFGSERIMTMVERFGMDEDTPIDARILSGSIENAQKRIEGENFQRRKNVLEYDDVMNQQRQIIYKQRGEVLDGMDLSPKIHEMIEGSVSAAVSAATASENKAEWNFDLLLEKFGGWLCRADDFADAEGKRASLEPENIRDLLLERAEALYA